MSSGRRKFLMGMGAASGALGVGALFQYRKLLYLLSRPPVEADSARPDWSGAQVQSYRPLGRTGFKMSDISLGAGRLDNADVVRLALDRGVNYIDTSPDYSDTSSERMVGEAIEGRRDQVFLASKFCTAKGHLPADSPVGDIMTAVEESLGRLRTDYLDLCHIHACNSVERLMAENFHEAFDRLKQQGKVRFMGVSSHMPELETVMHHAVDSGRFDVLMVAYNFRNWPDLDNVLDKAARRGVGFVAMKTLKGAYHSVLADFEPDERNSFAQAAFKWINHDPRVSGLVISMWKPSQLDEYLFASGKKAAPADLALLEKYDRVIAKEYCRPGCGECLDSCPEGLPIDDILRYTTYFEGYGNERGAMVQYSKLDPSKTAEVCAGCSAPCEGSCPFELPIRKKMVRAHQILGVKV